MRRLWDIILSMWLSKEASLKSMLTVLAVSWGLQRILLFPYSLFPSVKQFLFFFKKKKSRFTLLFYVYVCVCVFAYIWGCWWIQEEGVSSPGGISPIPGVISSITTSSQLNWHFEKGIHKIFTLPNSHPNLQQQEELCKGSRPLYEIVFSKFLSFNTNSVPLHVKTRKHFQLRLPNN